MGMKVRRVVAMVEGLVVGPGQELVLVRVEDHERRID